MSIPSVFDGINESQYHSLKEALPLITILIAGADGKIDEQELNWAEKLTYIRSYAEPEELNQFYSEVEDGFDSKVQQTLSALPDDLIAREEEISKKLSNLNIVLACLPNNIAYQVYSGFTSFAKHIAKASGGFLRFGSISSKEKPWISLPMIEPIILQIEEDESSEELQN